MTNIELQEFLKKHPDGMTVKMRHKTLTIADIDEVKIASFCKEISEPGEEVILLENEELAKEGYR